MQPGSKLDKLLTVSKNVTNKDVLQQFRETNQLISAWVQLNACSAEISSSTDCIPLTAVRTGEVTRAHK